MDAGERHDSIFGGQDPDHVFEESYMDMFTSMGDDPSLQSPLQHSLQFPAESPPAPSCTTPISLNSDQPTPALPTSLINPELPPATTTIAPTALQTSAKNTSPPLQGLTLPIPTTTPLSYAFVPELPAPEDALPDVFPDINLNLFPDQFQMHGDLNSQGQSTAPMQTGSFAPPFPWPGLSEEPCSTRTTDLAAAAVPDYLDLLPTTPTPTHLQSQVPLTNADALAFSIFMPAISEQSLGLTHTRGLGLTLPSGGNSAERTLDSEALSGLRRISHRRERKNSPSNNPTSFYKPLSERPASWGTTSTDNNYKCAFRYTEKGELETGKKYSTDELLQFITQRPQTSQRLILWIQNPPAQFNHRYPCGRASSICRWKDCPVKNNSILKGHWRVAFDERGNELGQTYDPFHNAGYIHLYCLEMAIDLIELFLEPTVDIRPDLRPMPKEERNPMALTRDHYQLKNVLEFWVMEQSRLYKERNGRSAPKSATEESFLYWRLTRAHVDLEGPARARGGRDGPNITNYLGNLSKFCKIKENQYETMRARQLHDGGRRRVSDTSATSLVDNNPPISGPATTENIKREPENNAQARRSSSIVEIWAGPTTQKRPQEEAGQGYQQNNSTHANKRRRVLSMSAQKQQEQQRQQERQQEQRQRQPQRAGNRLDGPQRAPSQDELTARRKSRTISQVLDAFKSSTTNDVINMVQTFPTFKQQAIQKLALKEYLTRKVGSI